MSDIIVFGVGVVVSVLVVFGIFSGVVQEMHDAKESGEATHQSSSDRANGGLAARRS